MKWYNIGLRLDVKKDELDTIDKETGNDTDEKLRRMLSSPEEGHLLTESARDVIFYSSHPLHFYTNPTRGVCAWLTLSPCLRELRGYRGQEPVLESCPARVVGSAATPPSGGLSPNGDNSNPFPCYTLFLVLVSPWVKNDVGKGLELSQLGESPPEGGVAALPTTLAGHDSSTGS